MTGLIDNEGNIALNSKENHVALLVLQELQARICGGSVCKGDEVIFSSDSTCLGRSPQIGVHHVTNIYVSLLRRLGKGPDVCLALNTRRALVRF